MTFSQPIGSREMIRRYKTLNLAEVTVPFVFERAYGSYVYDTTGTAKLDFTSGYGVANTGWMHPQVVQAVSDQLRKATYAPPWLATESALALSEVMLSLAPPGMAACLRATGGAEAAEGAFRAAQLLTGKRTMVSFERAYHGGTGKAVRASDFEAFQLMGSPAYGRRFIKVPFPGASPGPSPDRRLPDASEVLVTIEELFTSNRDISAFVAEPVIGSGGVLVPPDGFLNRLQALCRQHGILFILDEVITGFGRLGEFSAASMFGLSPDAILFAKGMGGGAIPIGCSLLNEALSQAVRRFGDVSPTFAWTPVACAAALANIRVLQAEGLCEKARVDGDTLLAATRQVVDHQLAGYMPVVRGKGMMIGIELTDPESRRPARRLVQKLLLALFHEGLMCCTDWDSRTIILMPPLTLTPHELEEGVHIIEKVSKRFRLQ